jgi:cell division septum initiation protein DivIVA
MNNAELNAVKTELERGYRVFKAFEHANDTVTALLNAEQVSRELEAANNALRTQGEKLAAEVENAKLSVEKSREAEKAQTAEAREKAKSILSAANAKAQRVLDDANQAAEKQAQAVAEGVAKLADINAQYEQTVKALAEAEQKLHSVKESVARMLAA